MTLTYLAVSYIYAALAASMAVGALMLIVCLTFWFNGRPGAGMLAAAGIGATVLGGLRLAEWWLL